MKFKKFGKALLLSALSVGLVLSVTSCVEDYSVGYLYVTGTVTSQSTGNGIISGFKIDHNTGKLTTIDGLPVPSGGANPVRALLLVGSKFLYVLNRGVSANPAGSNLCTTAYPCTGSNITEFAVGGNGILTQQQQFFSQGLNPFRILGDSSGSYLYVLDHDAPLNAACTLALGTPGPCGDITVFQINQTTGRLQLVVNAQVTAANGSALSYFPVPANPIDFAFNGSYFLTLFGTPGTGDSVFPYTYGSSGGQLSITQNSTQPLGIRQANAIVTASGFVYVLDNEPPAVSSVAGASSQILPYTVGTGGSLQPQTGGAVADDPTLSNPIYLIVEAKGKFLYLANQGNNTDTTNAQSGIAGYTFDAATHQLSFSIGEPFGSGAGPQCIVEDPSSQFIYEADYNDSSVNGRVVDPNGGALDAMKVTSNYALQGPATWCLVDGRTD